MRTRRSQSSGDPVSREEPSSSTGEVHRSVLLQETLTSLDIRENDTLVDATLGGAGHAKALVAKLGSGGTFIGIDADQDAIARAQEALGASRAHVHLVGGNFRDLRIILGALGVASVTKVLFDLGWSSYQLDSGRGFSFQKDEPLLMTYGKDANALNAATIVNTWSEQSIADVIYGWGEERYARRIAKAIIDRREQQPFKTSRELADHIKASVPASYRFGRIHPATRTFQALRIAVNDELGALKQGITAAWELLQPEGRIAVITFHSVEDREVKRLFAEFAKHGGERITKKPIRASKEELDENPRARSAKLRVIQKHEPQEISYP